MGEPMTHIRRWRGAIGAVLLGFLTLVAANLVPQALVAANLGSPRVGWSAPVIAVYLWGFWRYAGGAGWPRSTSGRRAALLAGPPATGSVWLWSLIAGAAGIVVLTALVTLLRPWLALGIALPEPLRGLPALTVVPLLLAVSASAGIVEEVAFRGVMQRSLDRVCGPVAATLLTAVAFTAVHLPAAPVRLVLIAVTGAGYGVLARRSGSIVPGIVIHAVGDALSLLWLWHRDAPANAASGATVGPAPAVVLGLGLLTMVAAYRRVPTGAQGLGQANRVLAPESR